MAHCAHAPSPWLRRTPTPCAHATHRPLRPPCPHSVHGAVPRAPTSSCVPPASALASVHEPPARPSVPSSPPTPCGGATCLSSLACLARTPLPEPAFGGLRPSQRRRLVWRFSHASGHTHTLARTRLVSPATPKPAGGAPQHYALNPHELRRALPRTVRPCANAWADGRMAHEPSFAVSKWGIPCRTRHAVRTHRAPPNLRAPAAYLPTCPHAKGAVHKRFASLT